MKNCLFIVVAVVFFTFFSGAGFAIEGPVGSGRVPPSGVRSGLVRSPNPIDTGGNLVITGNVGGGRHFRGIVPYNATTDFESVAGASQHNLSLLNSFLRRSAGSAGYQSYTGRPAPYYSPTGTVTTTRPGYPGVFRPRMARTEGRAAEGFALPTLHREKPLSDLDTEGWRPIAIKDVWEPVLNVRLRPMSMTVQELERELSEEVKKYPQGERLVAEQHQVEMEQFRRDLKRVSDKAVELSQKLIGEGASLQPFAEPELLKGLGQPFELPRPKELTGEEGFQTQKDALWERDKQFDVYEQMKLEIGKFQGSFGYTVGEVAVSEREEAADGEKEPSGADYQKASSLLKGLSGVDLSVRAKSILGSHKTFASFSNDKFNQHIRAGEEYLKQGRYYRAADVYTLASVYKPSDPLAYAGKSHALFAAGEYMSSALFLSRALEIFPEYARFKVDLVAMVGDRDKLENRIADVEEWLKISGAGELQFLLGYVYYQMGRLERAEEANEAAYEKMPDSPAVAALKKAIDESREPR